MIFAYELFVEKDLAGIFLLNELFNFPFFWLQFCVSVCTLVSIGEACNRSFTVSVQLLDLFYQCSLCFGLELLHFLSNW